MDLKELVYDCVGWVHLTCYKVGCLNANRSLAAVKIFNGIY
jgi:hypothetical protein